MTGHQLALLGLGLVLALSPSPILAQDNIGCFVPGECIGNMYIDITQQETVGEQEFSLSWRRDYWPNLRFFIIANWSVFWGSLRDPIWDFTFANWSVFEASLATVVLIKKVSIWKEMAQFQFFIIFRFSSMHLYSHRRLSKSLQRHCGMPVLDLLRAGEPGLPGICQLHRAQLRRLHRLYLGGLGMRGIPGEKRVN